MDHYLSYSIRDTGFMSGPGSQGDAAEPGA